MLLPSQKPLTQPGQFGGPALPILMAGQSISNGRTQPNYKMFQSSVLPKYPGLSTSASQQLMNFVPFPTGNATMQQTRFATPIHSKSKIRKINYVVTRPPRDDSEMEKVKKMNYRDDLISQMEYNRMSRIDKHRRKAEEDMKDEQRLARERAEIDFRLSQDLYNKRREGAKNNTQTQDNTSFNRSKSQAGISMPRNRSQSKSRDDIYYNIRDELSKNPKRRHDVVEAWWLDKPPEVQQQQEKEFWESGKWDVVKHGAYFDYGKYVPSEIGQKVKDLVNREVKMMKGKMQISEVNTLEKMKALKDHTQQTDKERLKALQDLKKLKAKLKKKLIKEDMRQNYIYDVLFQRWKDRERKLEDKYKKFPAVNSFPVELRHTQFKMPCVKPKKPGELPSKSVKVNENSVKVMDEMWPQLPTLDEYAKEKVNQDIFKAETLNKVNARRIHDLERFANSDDPLDRVDNEVFDFLNRESKVRVVNPSVPDGIGNSHIIGNSDLKLYQEVNIRDYSSPLASFSKNIVRSNPGNPNFSVDPLIHKLNAMN